MIRNAGARRSGFRTGAFSAGLIAAALLALTAGCGQFNDDPFDGGFIVRPEFDGSAQQSATASTGTSTPQAIVFTEAGPDVLTLVVGPIVITHSRDGSGTILAYTDELQVTDTNRELLEQDALQSVQFLEVVQLPQPGDTVEFSIPPDNAGLWQLIAVGLRIRRNTLEEIQNTDPIWYGFTGRFLNEEVKQGKTDFDLMLEAGCSLDSPPVPPC